MCEGMWEGMSEGMCEGTDPIVHNFHKDVPFPSQREPGSRVTMSSNRSVIAVVSDLLFKQFFLVNKDSKQTRNLTC